MPLEVRRTHTSGDTTRMLPNRQLPMCFVFSAWTVLCKTGHVMWQVKTSNPWQSELQQVVYAEESSRDDQDAHVNGLITCGLPNTCVCSMVQQLASIATWVVMTMCRAIAKWRGTVHRSGPSRSRKATFRKGWQQEWQEWVHVAASNLHRRPC